MSWDVVYVSPHLDDAALSCSARILRDVAAGKRVLVATVFSAGAPDEARRKREDRRAMKRLGVEHVHLDYRDAPWRNRRFDSFRAIVLGKADFRLRLRFDADEIVAPLAIGTHVDHRIVHAAFPRAMYYEDRPYAFVHDRKSFLEAPYVRAWLDDPAVADDIAFPRFRGRPEIVRGDLRTVERIVGEYRSQVGPLLGGRFRELSLAYSRRLGVRGYAERYWTRSAEFR
jgi:LmbE family N-acetylglucosaminyl deacetylase